jgi:hypothetical protein
MKVKVHAAYKFHKAAFVHATEGLRSATAQLGCRVSTLPHMVQCRHDVHQCIRTVTRKEYNSALWYTIAQLQTLGGVDKGTH